MHIERVEIDCDQRTNAKDDKQTKDEKITKTEKVKTRKISRDDGASRAPNYHAIHMNNSGMMISSSVRQEKSKA
ncbi:hypothetical protein Mapa_009216 [Marchantia paleacea]|nr:hypothetical protein Mapa_009216 [Marchantia paleacea]